MSSSPAHDLGSRALVTGGTSGLGLDFARALAAQGLALVIVARDADRLARTAAELGTRYGVEVETLVADMARRTDVEAVAQRLTDEAAPVDVLINNAGHGMHLPLATTDTAEHERSLDVMVRAVLVLGGAAAATMRERGRGSIINVASVASLIPMGAYSAIKAWVRVYSESLTLELAGTGVHVTALLPGWVRTEFHERAEIRTSTIPRYLWLSSPRVVAEGLAAVRRGKVRSIPSKRFRVIAFLAEHAPRRLVRWATTKVKGGRA